MIVSPISTFCLIIIQLLSAIEHILSVQAVGVSGTNMMVYALYRGVCVTVLNFLLAFMLEGAVCPRRHDLPMIFGLGAGAFFLNPLLYFWSLVRAGPAVCSTLLLMQSFFGYSLDVLMGTTEVTFRKITALFIAVGSAMALVGIQSLESHIVADASLLGIAGIVALCVTQSLFYVVQKPLLTSYPAITLSAWTYLVGTILMGICSAALYWDNNEVWYLSQQSRWPFLFLVVSSSFGAVVYNAANKAFDGVAPLLLFNALAPVFTCVLSWYFLNMKPQLYHFGILGIVSGVALFSL